MNITAKIYWDETGWGWSTQVDGHHDDTGPLDCADGATEADLIAALRRRLTPHANEQLDDDSITIDA